MLEIWVWCLLRLISEIVILSEHEVASYYTIYMLRNEPRKSLKSSEFDHKIYVSKPCLQYKLTISFYCHQCCHRCNTGILSFALLQHVPSNQRKYIQCISQKKGIKQWRKQPATYTNVT